MTIIDDVLGAIGRGESPPPAMHNLSPVGRPADPGDTVEGVTLHEGDVFLTADGHHQRIDTLDEYPEHYNADHELVGGQFGDHFRVAHGSDLDTGTTWTQPVADHGRFHPAHDDDGHGQS
jgi:hypothetical protein